MYWFEQTILNL